MEYLFYFIPKPSMKIMNNIGYRVRILVEYRSTATSNTGIYDINDYKRGYIINILYVILWGRYLRSNNSPAGQLPLQMETSDGS